MDATWRQRGRAEPAWVLFCIGWLAADAGVERWRAHSLERTRAAEVPDAPAPRDLSALSPRELRRLPSIGEGRAIAIARARWEHSGRPGPVMLDDVAGIGPATEARVRAWLDEQELLHPDAERVDAPRDGGAAALDSAPPTASRRGESLHVPGGSTSAARAAGAAPRAAGAPSDGADRPAPAPGVGGGRDPP
jgi:hypothetical protein